MGYDPIYFSDLIEKRLADAKIDASDLSVDMQRLKNDGKKANTKSLMPQSKIYKNVEDLKAAKEDPIGDFIQTKIEKIMSKLAGGY